MLNRAATNGLTQTALAERRTELIRAIHSVSETELRKAFKREYQTWKSMRARCCKPSNPSWRYYGAKGVSVCDRWHSFPTFLEDMGERPEGCSIERIDSNGNYELSNCRWATAKEQGRNRPGYNRLVTYNGQSLCPHEWSEVTGIDATTIRSRIDRFGWTPEQALTIPPVMGANNVHKSKRQEAADAS